MNPRYYFKYNNLTTINNGGIHNLKYLSSKPNALTDHKYENINTTVTNSVFDKHEYTYTPFDKLASINQADGKATLEMAYGVDQQRIHMQVAENNYGTIDNYYVGSANMEIKNNVEHTYLYAEGKPFAIYKGNIWDGQLYYLHLDNQGSLMAISNNDGDVVDKRSYDAWGRPRNPDNWEYNLGMAFGGAGFGITLRGYTMHEHLEMFNLINMNGRLYDPVLGRMLSPDNIVPDATSTQGYNRYSYVLNNPLKYTDPSGNEPVTLCIIAGAIIGSYIGGSLANNNNFNPTQWDYGSSKTWIGMGIGAVVGGSLGYLVGAGIPLVISGTTPMGSVPLLKVALGSKYTTLSLLPFPGFVGYKGIEFTIKHNKINIDPHSWFMNDYDRIIVNNQLSSPMPNNTREDVFASNGSSNSRWGENLKLNSSTTFISDGGFLNSNLKHSLLGGQHVRVELTNMNIFGAQLNLEDKSSFTYQKSFFGINQQIYTGDSYTFILLPGQTRYYDFYKSDYVPIGWTFEVGTTISEAVNVQIRFYSNWVIGMPYDPLHPNKKK